MCWVGVAANDFSRCADDNRWAIARGTSVRVLCIDFLKHRIVGIEIDNINGLKISLVAVCSQLNLVGETRTKITNELNRCVLRSVADVPRYD